MSGDHPTIDFAALPPVVGGSTFGTELWIATGHLRSKKREAFVSIVTLLAVVGVVAGVAILNWVIAVMAGFEDDLRDKILGANAHIVLHAGSSMIADPAEALVKVKAVPGVVNAGPFVYGEMMARSDWSTTGVIVKGLDPDLSRHVTTVWQDLTIGPKGAITSSAQRDAVFEALKAPIPRLGSEGFPVPEEIEPLLPAVIIGSELMEKLGVVPGDKLTLVNPASGRPGPMGLPVPDVKQFRVAAVYHSGMFEYDAKWIYLPNSALQSFLGVGTQVTGIEILIEDPDLSNEVGKAIEEKMGFPWSTNTWQDRNAKLFEALQFEKWVMALILNMVVVNAALLITSTLIMIVLTKGREIAILKAMGATNAMIVRIFVMEGALIGLTGSVLGTLLGLFGCWALTKYEYPLETDVYYVSTLPVSVEPGTVAFIAVSALVVTLLATIYPARQAAVLDPVEGLRYE